MTIAADFHDGPAFDQHEIVLWSGAAAVVVGLHLAAWLYFSQLPPSYSPPDEAASAVMIDLAPVAIAPEAVPTEMAELVDSATADPVDDPVEKAEPIPEPEPVVDEIVETMEPIIEPETVPEMTEAAETAQPVLDTTEVETERPEPVEEVAPDLVELPTPEVAMAAPEQREVLEPKPAKPVEVRKPAKKTPPKTVRKPAPPPQNASRKSAENAPTTAAPRANQGSAGTSVSPARWQSKVSAHVNRRARSVNGGRMNGRVGVRLTINPQGAITSVSVSRSSGDSALDSLALNAVRRASPVPAPPPSIARQSMPLSVSINFR